MNNIEIHGTITFNPTKNEWEGSGGGWWISKSKDNIARIAFSEPIAFDEHKELIYKDYSLTISNINNTGNIETYNVDRNGFNLKWENFSNSLCIASFIVIGTKLTVVKDDRNLTNEENIADIYASALVFDYQAQYGMITVMGSASIVSKETSSMKMEMINEFSKNLEIDIANENNESRRLKLQYKLELANEKIKRQNTIQEKCSQYWNSAKKFGELWGDYAVKDQCSKLGGRYVPICTGGGPGIMGAVAQGARNKNAHVLGIDCQFGKDNYFNLKDSPSIFSNVRLRMNNMAIRESALINNSHVILFWPGGLGTAWEVFETLSKLQTTHLKKHRVKAIFVHTDYWKPLFKLLNHMRDFGAVKDTDRIKIPGVDDSRPDEYYIGEVVDTAEKAFEKTRDFVEELYNKNQLMLREE